jgi:hypothetical protein
MGSSFKLKYLRNLYQKTIKVINLIDPKRRKSISKMMDEIAPKMFSCPASYRIDYNSCFPGGLVHHSLKVMKYMVRLAEGLKYKDYNKDSVVILSLFHGIGKIGDGVDDFYLPNDDYWKSRGYHYKINDKFNKISPHHLSLYLLQKYDIELTYEEYMAIIYLLNKQPTYSENEITLLLNHAIIWAVAEEKKEKLNLIEEVDEKEQVIELPQIIETQPEIPAVTMPDGIINFDEAIKKSGLAHDQSKDSQPKQ